MRMSSGPPAFVENPRAGSSSCIEETPRSATNAIGPGQIGVGQHLGQTGEVAAERRERLRAKTRGAQAGFGLGQFNRVRIQSDQASAGLESRQNFLRMTAVTKRAIHRQFAGPRREHFQNFRHHDGPVRSGRRFAGREHFRHGVAVALRVALLVFLLEPARVFAGITRTPSMRGPGRGIA